MKNSTRFSAEDWQDESFLSSTQLNTCRALFFRNSPQLAFFVLSLTQLNADLKGKNPASTYLTPSELERLVSFTFAKRHVEWLGGRIAAKKAARALLDTESCPPIDYQDLSVEIHPTGRPFLHCRIETSVILPEISISHSGNYAGALSVMGQSCGLDLQRITSKVITVRDRFASPAELALILSKHPALAESTALTLLWSAKEAFRKAIACQPLVGFSEITLLGLEGDPQNGMTGHFSCPRLTPTSLPAFLLNRGEYACAITVIGPPA